MIIFLLTADIYIPTNVWGFSRYFSKAKPPVAAAADWKDKGPTPLGHKKFTPQGLTWVNGKLIFANSWKDVNSRIYEIDPASMKILRYFDMPEEAVHTSGLAWDGRYLWGVDFISNRAYCIDLEASLVDGAVRVVGGFDTTLQGTSACCILPWKGNDLLVVSDFMKSKKTVVIRTETALKTGTADSAIEFSYENGGFSQGLEFAQGYIYESENRFGIDIINKLDVERLKEFGHASKAMVAQYPAPSKSVEDLAWDGKSMWTSDEWTFKFYTGTLK